MDEPRDPEIPPPPPLPGGFKPDEPVTNEQLQEIRNSWFDTTHSGLKTDWGELRKAFGQLMEQNLVQQGLFRDEAKEDRRTLIAVSKLQIEEGSRNLSRFIKEGEQRRADLTTAMTTFGEALDRLHGAFAKQQSGFDRMERVVLGVGAVVLIVFGIFVVGWANQERVEQRVDRVERRIAVIEGGEAR